MSSSKTSPKKKSTGDKKISDLQYQDSLVKLYEGKEYVLWQSGDTKTDTQGLVCVSFAARNDHGPKIFGLGFFEKKNIPVFYIQPLVNDWYQSTEMEQICLLIKEHSGNNKLLLYGSSMGGFGALLYAKDLGASRCVAISPQASIKDEIVGSFDSRWHNYAKAIKFLHDDVNAQWHPGVCETLLIYDPYLKLDRTHIDMIAPDAHESVVHFRIPLVGHPATHALSFGSVLSSLMTDLLSNQINMQDCVKAAWKKYRVSPARKYVVAIGLGFVARREKRHTLWSKKLTMHYKTEGLAINLGTLKRLIKSESQVKIQPPQTLKTSANLMDQNLPKKSVVNWRGKYTLKHLLIAQDALQAWPGIKVPSNSVLVKNTSELIDLRTHTSDGELKSLDKIRVKFTDRHIKPEMVWEVPDARLKNRVLFGDFGRVSLFTKGAALLDQTIEQKMAENPGSFEWRPNDEKNAEFLEGTTAMIDAPGATGNYYHWTLEVMPRLYAILPYIKSGEIQRLAFITLPLKSFQHEFLQMLIGDDWSDKVISLQGGSKRFEKFIFFDNRAEDTRVTNQALDFIKFIREKFIAGQQLKPTKRYVERGQGSFRRLLEESQLTERLCARGFQLVEGGKLSVQGQIESFLAANTVIGVHGAGLTNLAFANPSATFIELTSHSYQWRCTYSDLALALGMKVKIIILDEVGEYISNTECPDLTCTSADNLAKFLDTVCP